jgi:hypothetical protein
MESTLRICCENRSGQSIEGLRLRRADLVVRHYFQRPHQRRVVPRLATVRGTRIEELLGDRGAGQRQPYLPALLSARLRSFWYALRQIPFAIRRV